MEHHGGAAGMYIGNLVFGGLDGILTSFAVVSGAAGADLGSRVVSILGVSSLVADGLAMGVGAYLSARSEKEYYHEQYQKEMYEVEHMPEIEWAELHQIYLHQGYSDSDARTLADIHSRNPERWVNAMLVEELGLLKDPRNPVVCGLAMFASFVLVGIAPLLIYLFGLAFAISAAASFASAAALSALAIFFLGAAKVLVTKRNLLRSGAEMLLVGGLTAGAAYALGLLLKVAIA